VVRYEDPISPAVKKSQHNGPKHVKIAISENAGGGLRGNLKKEQRKSIGLHKRPGRGKGGEKETTLRRQERQLEQKGGKNAQKLSSYEQKRERSEKVEKRGRVF